MGSLRNDLRHLLTGQVQDRQVQDRQFEVVAAMSLAPCAEAEQGMLMSQNTGFQVQKVDAGQT